MFIKIKVMLSTGVTDHLCDIDSNLLSDAELNYGYSYNLMVDEDYKTSADAICEAFHLCRQYYEKSSGFISGIILLYPLGYHTYQFSTISILSVI